MIVVAAPRLRNASVGVGRELFIASVIAVAVAVTFVLAPISGMSVDAIRLESVARVAVVGIPVGVNVFRRANSTAGQRYLPDPATQWDNRR